MGSSYDPTLYTRQSVPVGMVSCLMLYPERRIMSSSGDGVSGSWQGRREPGQGSVSVFKVQSPVTKRGYVDTFEEGQRIVTSFRRMDGRVLPHCIRRRNGFLAKQRVVGLWTENEQKVFDWDKAHDIIGTTAQK